MPCHVRVFHVADDTVSSFAGFMLRHQVLVCSHKLTCPAFSHVLLAYSAVLRRQSHEQTN